MFFKSITGLAKGCYAVVLKQFDANNIDYTGITNGAEAAAGEKFTITLKNSNRNTRYVTLKYTVNGVETTVHLLNFFIKLGSKQQKYPKI